MTLHDVAQELGARVLTGTDQDLTSEVTSVAAGDLMSDILARVGRADILVTGLTTSQAIRTASVAGIRAVVIVRGKPVNEQMIELAREEGVVLMQTDLKLFETAGRLWTRGLRTGTGPT